MSDTAAIHDLDFPMPKYRRGQKVWYGWVDTRPVTLACPDCLGTRRWKVITPAGAELDADCQRCGGYNFPRGVPSLKTFEYAETVRELTIGSVQINTAPSTSWHESSVRYMCHETGVGSGSVYDEDQLAETEEGARILAQVKVNESNRTLEAKPERIEQYRFQYLNLKDAAVEMADSATWNAWYRYRMLHDDIEGLMGDDGVSANEMRERLTEILNWDSGHRADKNPFAALVDAAQTAAERHGDVDLAAALANMPSRSAASRASGGAP